MLAPFCLVFTLAACSDAPPLPPPPADAGISCQDGQVPAEGGTCAPRFDRCEEDEVALYGGGCKAVGVRECSTGTKKPGASKCTPAGVPEPCPSGWERVKGASCAKDDNCEAYCRPRLPTSACPAGSMAVPGKTTCQPVGDCGSGTWGKIKGTSSTIYVDPAYPGGGSDGSQSKPFTTLSAAHAKATDGSHLALAAGTYQEGLLISEKNLIIEGRCPKLVELAGTGVAGGRGTIHSGAAGTTVRGVTITSTGNAVTVAGGGEVILERCVVADCGEEGILTANDARVEAKDTLFEGNHGAAISLEGTRLTLLARSAHRGPVGCVQLAAVAEAEAYIDVSP